MSDMATDRVYGIAKKFCDLLYVVSWHRCSSCHLKKSTTSMWTTIIIVLTVDMKVIH